MTEDNATMPPVTLDEVRQYFGSVLLAEETTAEQHKEMFARVVASRDSLTGELSRLKKDRLERMGGMSGRGMKKDRLVRYVMDDIIEDFSLGKVRTSGRITSDVIMTEGGMLKLTTEIVGELTDADLVEHRRQVAERREARREAQAETERAVTDPQTEGDFETFIHHHGMIELRRLSAAKQLPRKEAEQRAILYRAGIRAMNDEQLELYDEIQARKGAERREQQLVDRATVKRIEIGEGNYMEVHEWWHDKRMCQTWLVVLAEREDRTTFEELCIAARKLGGNYSRQWGTRPGGFQFFEEGQARKFVSLQSRDVFELKRLERLIAGRERVRSNAVAHFTGLGGRMEERAHAALHQERKINTERRLMLALAAQDSAREDIAMAGTLRAHAEALLRRTAVHTDKIRWRTHAEAFDDIHRRASGRMAAVEYPWPEIGKHTLLEIAGQIKDKDGSILVSRRIIKWCEESPGHTVRFVGRSMTDTLRHFYRRARLHRVRGWSLDAVREAMGHFKRAQLMGLETLPELRAALREHLRRRVNNTEPTRADLVMAGLYPGKFPPDYFPTPRDVVELMLTYADMEDGLSWLEPSAGSGHIANVVAEQFPNARGVYVEISGLLCRALEEQSFYPVQADFLSLGGNWCAHSEAGFDRVIANVPFGADGVGTDIDHVRHAHTMLNPATGRLVSLMSEGVFYRGDAKAQEFRSWLDFVGGVSFELPEGAFLNADRPTSWAARIVVIDNAAPPEVDEELIEEVVEA